MAVSQICVCTSPVPIWPMSKQEWDLLLNMNNKAWIVHLDCTCAPLARQYPDLYLSTCICVQAAPIIRSLISERKRQDSIRHQGQVGAWALRQRSSFAGVTSTTRRNSAGSLQQSPPRHRTPTFWIPQAQEHLLCVSFSGLLCLLFKTIILHSCFKNKVSRTNARGRECKTWLHTCYIQPWLWLTIKVQKLADLPNVVDLVLCSHFASSGRPRCFLCQS